MVPFMCWLPQLSLPRRCEPYRVERDLAFGTRQFCLPLPGSQPPFNYSLWMSSEQYFYAIKLVPADVGCKLFKTDVFVLQAGFGGRGFQMVSRGSCKFSRHAMLGLFYHCNPKRHRLGRKSLCQEASKAWTCWDSWCLDSIDI